jgi:hypothetical protein
MEVVTAIGSERSLLTGYPGQPFAFTTQSIEKKVAHALDDTGEFQGVLTTDDLQSIFQTALPLTINRHSYRFTARPVDYDIEGLRVSVKRQGIKVNGCIVLRSPIQAELFLDFILENDPRAPFSGLRLKKDSLFLMEQMDASDTVTREVLDMMDIRQIAEQELANPGNIIIAGLIRQLIGLGFQHPLKEVSCWMDSHHMVQLYLSVL